MTSKFFPLITVLLLFMLSGCYPELSDDTDDLDRVYTDYSNQFDFKSKMTYSIPDKIIKISGEAMYDPDGDGKPTFLRAEYSDAVLSQIKENMSRYGWTLVDKNNNPDLVLLISASTTTDIYYQYSWAYWNWWYPGAYALTLNWYYPGNFYNTTVAGYSTGSIFIQMIDHKAGRQPDKVDVVWNCILEGLVEESITNTSSRIRSGINAAFAQSTYLKH